MHIQEGVRYVLTHEATGTRWILKATEVRGIPGDFTVGLAMQWPDRDDPRILREHYEPIGRVRNVEMRRTAPVLILGSRYDARQAQLVNQFAHVLTTRGGRVPPDDGYHITWS